MQATLGTRIDQSGETLVTEAVPFDESAGLGHAILVPSQEAPLTDAHDRGTILGLDASTGARH
ncbi:MAG TPA: hypothetical protein VFE42_31980 [Chloroflexota bacterium]|nr:hypothetical protein [Chloroflexota bacterium]